MSGVICPTLSLCPYVTFFFLERRLAHIPSSLPVLLHCLFLPSHVIECESQTCVFWSVSLSVLRLTRHNGFFTHVSTLSWIFNEFSFTDIIQLYMLFSWYFQSGFSPKAQLTLGYNL